MSLMYLKPSLPPVLALSDITNFGSLSSGFVSGLKAAVNTKERIIARREQLNPLEGKIQHLIQTVEKLNQVKSLMMF